MHPTSTAPTHPDPIGRRRFLQSIAVGTAALGLEYPPLAAQRAPAGAIIRSPSARSAIFLVADGMNAGTLSLAHQYSHRVLGRTLSWMRCYHERSDLHRGLMETSSADSIVTDSAAASSSWGCGRRMPNGALNVDAEGSHFAPIALPVKESGRSVGLVTTARISHATPAGFAANVGRREEEDTIAGQYLERGIDCLLGGGSKHFIPEKRGDGRDLLAAYAQSGYSILRQSQDLNLPCPEHSRILGLFSSDHLPYLIDRRRPKANHPDRPTLAQMTRVALAHLDRNPQGFLLQVEGARVDHAGHANDPAAILHEMLDFDDAVEVVLGYATHHPETLVVLTTDHGTGGLNINGAGAGYRSSGPHLDRLAMATGSLESAIGLLSSAADGEELTSLAGGILGTSLDRDQARFLESQWSNASPQDRPEVLWTALRRAASEHFAVGWTSLHHTGDLVEVAAFGPGAEMVHPFVRNTDLHQVLVSALGLD